MYTATFALAETAAALRSGKWDLLQYIEDACDRIEAVEAHVHALIEEPNRRQRLRQDAQTLLHRFPDPAQRPPLFGVLVGVKDIFRVDGFATQAGSQLPADLFEGAQADSVTLLKQAGALIAGKSVTTEFAYFQPGPTRNPHNLAHTPGGSSSGSAAGVAAGEFQLALGTQTIGSVIRPAAFCGIVGFKPSYDRIPSAGLLYFSKSLDHVGLFAQDLDGMALAASVLCEGWDADLASLEATRAPVLAVPEGPYLLRAEPEGRTAFAAQVSRLEAAGFVVKRAPFLTNFDELERKHRRMMAAEAVTEHEGWYAQHADLYSHHMHAIMEIGRSVDAAELAQSRRERLTLRQQVAAELARLDADLWIAPPATGPAPEGIAATGNPIMNLPWTNAGVPALTVPAGRAENGLPLGLQIIAPFGQDERLLAWARQIEKEIVG